MCTQHTFSAQITWQNVVFSSILPLLLLLLDANLGTNISNQLQNNLIVCNLWLCCVTVAVTVIQRLHRVSLRPSSLWSAVVPVKRPMCTLCTYIS